MTPSTSGHGIALLLAQVWDKHRTQAFSKELADIFGNQNLDSVLFDCLYICEAKEGNIHKGFIGGLINMWWIVDDSGMRPITKPDLPRFPDEPENLRSVFYKKPVIRFYCNGSHVVIGESFGPKYKCQKLGEIMIEESNLRITNVKVVWSSRRP